MTFVLLLKIFVEIKLFSSLNHEMKMKLKIKKLDSFLVDIIFLLKSIFTEFIVLVEFHDLFEIICIMFLNPDFCGTSLDMLTEPNVHQFLYLNVTGIYSLQFEP